MSLHCIHPTDLLCPLLYQREVDISSGITNRNSSPVITSSGIRAAVAVCDTAADDHFPLVEEWAKQMFRVDAVQAHKGTLQ